MTVNVYHKHSVVKDKAPEVKQIELGEIAINANQDSPSIYIKDSADRIVKIGGDISSIEVQLEELKFLIAHLEELLGEIPDKEKVIKLLKTLIALEAQIQLLAEHNKDQDDTLQSLSEADTEINERIDNLTAHVNQQIEDLLNLIKALEAQVLLSAKHNADQDKHLERIDQTIDLIEQDINALVKRIEALEQGLGLNVDALEKRVEKLEAITFEAGEGIVIKDKGNYTYKISLNKKWLESLIEEKLKPYALIDFGTHTDEVPGS